MVANKATIVTLNSFSSHMQHDQLLDYYSDINCEKIYLVHGQQSEKVKFANELKMVLAKKCKTTNVVCVNKSTEGRIDVLNKVRTEKRADAYAIDKVMDDIDIQHTHIYIIHSDFLEGASHFKKCFIEKGVPEQNIHIDYISSVIAVHTGLGCIAIQYIREEN